MNYAEKYIKRLNDEGLSFQDSYINQSKIIATNKIMNSSTKYEAFLDLINTNTCYCMTKDKDGYKKRKFIFVPDTIVNIGTYVTVNNLTYLLSTKETNEITPEFVGDLCTSNFPIKYEDEEIEIGTDDLGRPVYDIIEGRIENLPCVIKMNDASTAIAETNESINLLDNQIRVTIKYTEAPSIKHNNQFEMYNEIYRIIRIDASGSIDKVGILRITGERVESSDGGVI